jgi:Glycosyl transferases group 1
MYSRLRIAVSGLAATYPLGGMFWHYMQYLTGLLCLGHEVLYVEDHGKWCYDPIERTFTERGDASAAYLAKHIGRIAPEASWFFRDAAGQTFGMSWPEVTRFLQDADIFLHVSGGCWRDEYFRAGRRVYIDTDPMYSQDSVPEYVAGVADAESRARIDKLLRHDVFFTFAENIGAADCLVPTQLFQWRRTRQPIVRDLFDRFVRPVSERRRIATTVGSWRSAVETGPIVGGVRYAGKNAEFEKFISLPAKSPLPLELSISGHRSLEVLREHGWNVRDAYATSSDPWVYCNYLASSFAEWTPAKNAYVASRSGWFSERSACYLALGVPAVVQDTGFSRYLQTGEGLIVFDTIDEAVEGLRRVAAEPERHARAAREIVTDYFDSSKVLSRLIEEAFGSSDGPKSRRSS